jgi:5-methylcytosine-specific restriction endonuclease McrA
MLAGRIKIRSAVLLAVLFFLGLILSGFADARGRGHSQSRGDRSSHQSYSKSRSGKTKVHKKSNSRAGKRDRKSHIRRSSKAKAAFMRSHPCPSTGKTHGACPGYVVDHITPLKRGGADRPSNMQWQTVREAKAKDKWE